MGKNIKKVIGFLGCSLSAALFARAVGKAVYARTPKGGINESMYIDVNGSKQWINIYGKDKNNPVLLYCTAVPVRQAVISTMPSRANGRTYIRSLLGINATAARAMTENKTVSL